MKPAEYSAISSEDWPPSLRVRSSMSGVAADLEVGDSDASDGDGDQPERSDGIEAAVDGMSAPEAAEREDAQGAADEAAHVAADRHAVQREAERQIQNDDNEGRTAEDVDVVSFEDKPGAQDSEDRAGGADRRLVRRQEE